MKTLDQIYRYISDCRFPDEDWQKILTYCRRRYRGGKIHKALYPKSDSTFNHFRKWVNDGFGAGDMVSYGKTMGVVGSSTPSGITLAAYCDYEGNLIIRDMEVQDPERLLPLENTRQVDLKRLIFEKGMAFYVRTGKFNKLYTPEKYFYVIIDNPRDEYPGVGMYLESDKSKHHFVAYLSKDKLELDCWINSDYTPLKPATEADIKRLHSATSKAGWSYNERCHKFIKTPQRGQDNVYWYLNDRFELVMDRDNGAKKHKERWDAGNYILDYTEGVLFMQEVRQMRGKA